MTLPVADGNPALPLVPGARRHTLGLDEAHARLREVVRNAATFAPLPSGPDEDPILGPLFKPCGARLHVPRELAILPPSLRFNRLGHRVFAAMKWMNGVSGYGLRGSDFRPGVSIWSFSESGLLKAEEFGSPSEWLLELCEGLESQVAGQDPERLWATIKGDLPNPEPALPLLPPLKNGVSTSKRDGVLAREEHYRGGLRHGRLRWWHIVGELAPDADFDGHGAEVRYRQGPVAREGTFRAGEAQGEFRFYDELGRPTYEVAFERGWPEGTCVVHPFAVSGLCEPVRIRYVAGVPVSASIPFLAYSTAALQRAGTPPATLEELAGKGPVLLVDCSGAAEHPLSEEDDRELAALRALVIGVAPQPGRGKVGSRAIDIVGDRDGKLARAYGHRHEKLLPLTVLRAGGTSDRAGFLQNLSWVRRQWAEW